MEAEREAATETSPLGQGQQRQSSFTTNPLWESFEGFKLDKKKQVSTPEIKKQRPVPAESSETPQLLAATPCTPQTPEFQSPAEFHSPAMFSPDYLAARQTASQDIIEAGSIEHVQ